MPSSKSQVTAESLYDEEAQKLIRTLAKSVIGKYGFRRSDRDDIEQELALDLCRRSADYDPTLLDRKIFVTSILRNKLRSLIRANKRLKRQLTHEDNVLFRVPDGSHRHYVPPRAMDDLEQLELRLDVDAILDELPPELREVSELLKSHSARAAARELGISRRQLEKRIEELRTHFEELREKELNKKAGASVEMRSISNGGECDQTTSTTSGNSSTMSTIIISEPAEVYHAKAGEYLSSHLLSDFRKCPLLYYQKKLGIIQTVDRPAYVIGRAVHTLVLEGDDQFNTEYVVGGPINPKTNAPFGPNTKAFAEWQASQGKTVLTESQLALVNFMAAGVRAHKQAAQLLANGMPEGVVRTEYCGVPCQIRMDWFESHTGIVDLKTCDDLTWFEADARRYSYMHQLAFYRSVLAEVIGLQMPVHLIAVEKREPYRCGVWQLSDDSLAIARQENEAAIARLKQCQADDQWPTGYEEPRLLDAA